MNKNIEPPIIILILCIVLFANPNFATCIAQNKSDTLTKKNKIDPTLQHSFASSVKNINEFDSLCYKNEKLNDSIRSYKEKISIYLGDTIRNTKLIGEIFPKSSNQKQDSIYDRLKTQFKQETTVETNITTELNCLRELLFPPKQTQIEVKQEIPQKEIPNFKPKNSKLRTIIGKIESNNVVNVSDSLVNEHKKQEDSSKINLIEQDSPKNTNSYNDTSTHLINQLNDSIYIHLISHFRKVFQADTIIGKLNMDLAEVENRKNNIKHLISTKQAKYDSTILEIKSIADTTFGFKKYIDNNGKRYLLFFADNKKHIVKIMGNSGKEPATIKSVLNSCKEPPLMITNAGMYQPNYEPQGLLISKRIKEMEIDSSRNYRDGNFYLYPNGIFFIDTASKFHILNTSDYLKTYYKSKNVEYATQSGPLLIDDRKLNNNINMGSSNYNIRSGVGVIDEKKVVFIISEDKVSFYEFKTVFANWNCKSALYFDGFVSRMYCNDKYPQRAPVLNDYNLGPMIVVYPKK